MNKNAIIGVVIVLVFGAGAWFYLGGSSSPSSTGESGDINRESSGEAPSGTPLVGQSVNGIEEFTVTGQKFSFNPSSIVVKKGDQVKITFKSLDGLHDFKIDEFGAATKRVNAGEEDTITFTADKTGSFEYYCSVGTHRAMGMHGTLTVEEN